MNFHRFPYFKNRNRMQSYRCFNVSGLQYVRNFGKEFELQTFTNHFRHNSKFMLTNENSSVVLTETNPIPLLDWSEHNVKSHQKFRARKPFVMIFGKDKDTRFLFKTALEIWQYEVAEAETAEEIFRIAERKSPDLILMDTEIEFTKSLKTMKKLQSGKHLGKPEFFLVSGHAQEDIRKMALAAGASVFLVKPIDFEALEISIRLHLAKNKYKYNKEGFYE